MIFAIVSVLVVFAVILINSRRKSGFDWYGPLLNLAILGVIGGVLLTLFGLSALMEHPSPGPAASRHAWLQLGGGVVCFLFGVGVILWTPLAIFVDGIKERRRERLARNAANPPS